MAITNKRTSILENKSEDRLKSKLKEGYKRFILKEDAEDFDMGEDEVDADPEMDMAGDDLGLEGGGDEMDMGADMGMEDDMMSTDPLADLTPDEASQVDAWVDELLSDNLDNVEVDGAAALDTEMPAGDIDPLGEEQYVKEDLPMTADELNTIISSDDSLGALGTELAGLATDGGDELGAPADDMGIGATDGVEEEDMMEAFDFEAGKVKTEEDEDDAKDPLDEAGDPMKGIEQYFDQGFEGEDMKDELTEDVELAKDNKDLGMEQVAAGLNDKIDSKVTATPGFRSEEDLAKDTAGVVQESVKKSKMLVKAAGIIAAQKKAITKKDSMLESLKLENYRLIKANGLLSVSGDQLSKEARTKISESFEKCTTVDQVNNFYNKLVESIKTNARPSLNEAVNSSKNKLNVLKENAETKESVTQEQMRINMLMGLNTERDVYFN